MEEWDFISRPSWSVTDHSVPTPPPIVERDPYWCVPYEETLEEWHHIKAKCAAYWADPLAAYNPSKEELVKEISNSLEELVVADAVAAALAVHCSFLFL